jgi:CRISPR-associated endonuclease/helicase Cas3
MRKELPEFALFTELVRGYEPFPWQSDLCALICGGELPPVIDVPTGLGKTAVIDCWVYALGKALAKGNPRPPLRLCFVVDRRLIVDAAFEHARVLQHRLAAALVAEEEELGTLAQALAALGGDPLVTVRMRGGASWESRWLARPDQAAVVVGTVDQVGSRLLFRGYGAGARMRPIDAALVGTDAWLVIDEAHIARPLVETARRAACLQRAAEQPFARDLVVTAMSATPAASVSRDLFRADPETQMHSATHPRAAAEARRRLRAQKPVALVELPSARKTATLRERATSLGEMLADVAVRIDSEAELIGVLCSTVAAARAAHAHLEAQGQVVALLIGRCREYERRAILDEWLPLIEVGARRVGERRYVVATQTIEVGANLDLDAVVCEVAPVDSLVQRFGRVNRIGERKPFCSAIAHCRGYHEADPVYGQATEETWKHLTASADGQSVAVASGSALDSLRLDGPQLELAPLKARGLARSAPSSASRVEEYVPVLLGSDVERWAATSPAPEPEQAVAPFLRGRVSSAPEVYVAWRLSPPVHDDTVSGWAAWLALSPPVEWEFVAVPVWEVRALVRARLSDRVTSDLEGDIEGSNGARDESEATQERGEEVLLGVAYTNDPHLLAPVRLASDVTVGSHVILRSDLGGHDRWGWTGLRLTGDREVVPDVADLAPTRRRAMLRLQGTVLCSVLGEETRELVERALDRLDPQDSTTLQPTVAELAKLADNVGARLLGDLLLRASEERWRLDDTPLIMLKDHQVEPVGVLTLREPHVLALAVEAISDADESSSSQMAAPVILREHMRSVAELAGAFADHLGLAPQLGEAVTRAALWHDLGKADPRFQTMLHDGDELAAQVAPALLAKSGRDPADPLAREAAKLAGVPRGFRHEAVSARIVGRVAHEHPELLEGLDGELVQHLVASHHGYGRPLLPALIDAASPAVCVAVPVVEPDSSVNVEVDSEVRQVDWTHPGRFEVLCKRYGCWGLALLEATVRLADMLVSENGTSGIEEAEHDVAHTTGAAR